MTTELGVLKPIRKRFFWWLVAIRSGSVRDAIKTNVLLPLAAVMTQLTSVMRNGSAQRVFVGPAYLRLRLPVIMAIKIPAECRQGCAAAVSHFAVSKALVAQLAGANELALQWDVSIYMGEFVTFT